MLESGLGIAPYSRRDFLLVLTLVVGTLVVFAPAVSNGFVNFDDPLYVTDNPRVSGLSAENLAWAFRTGHTANWHPLTWMSLQLDTQLFGRTPWGYHLSSVLLHALNAALLYGLFRLWTGRRGPSLLVAALFALHPLHVESVAWVSGRKDVLSTVFGLLCLWAWTRATLAEGFAARRWLAGSVALYVLSLLAKQMLVTLPFLMLLIDVWPLRRWPRVAIQNLLLEKVPFLLAAIVFSMIAFQAQSSGGTVQSVHSFPVWVRAANAVVAYALYLRKTLWPLDLAAFYPHPGAAISMMTVAVAALVLIILSGLALLMARRRPWLAVGWCWFVGTLVPVIGLVQIGEQQLADRYTYFPLIGIFMAAAWELAEFTGRRPRVGVIAGGLLVVACGLLSARQVRTWRDPFALNEHAVKVVPGNWLAYTNLGCEWHARGDFEKARQNFAEAYRFKPGHPNIQTNLGNILRLQGRMDEARTLLQQALQADPRLARGHYYWGYWLADQREFDAALAAFDRAAQLDPGDAFARAAAGNLLRSLNRKSEATARYEAGFRANPTNLECRIGLARGLAERGELDAAQELLEAAVQLAPQSLEAHTALALVYHQQGSYEAAVPVLRHVVSLQDTPDHRTRLVTALINQSTQQLMAGHAEGAGNSLAEAIALDPANADAHHRLGRLLAASGSLAAARREFELALQSRPDSQPIQDDLKQLLEQIREGP